MVVVQRGKGESSEIVWRKFGKINYEENLVDELRDRKYYKKPSIKKKEIEERRRKIKRRRRNAHV
ncbi:MAG: 30S ribosomal protein S21 [Patescibacteria group bacterium]